MSTAAALANHSDQAVVTPQPLKIALVAGEASGDQLGAGLIKALTQSRADIQYAGIGGPQMQAAGLQVWWPADTLAVMGLFEVAKHLPRLIRLRKALVQRLLAWEPDVFIGIDAPDFNLGLEKILKQHSIKTIHYVSPSVWAWRQKRVHNIAAAVDRILTLFPFETEFYHQHGIDAVFVGHPMADELSPVIDPSPARQRLSLAENRATIALLPGSRKAEVNRLSLPFLQACRILLQQQPELQLVAAAANQKTAAILQQAQQQQGIQFPIAVGQAREVISAADVCMIASGTATLEAMLLGKPMVVCYRLAASTYWLAKALRLIKIEHIALPNILAGHALVPELIQQQLSPTSLAQAVQNWLNEPQQCQQLTKEFSRLRASLTNQANQTAAAAVLQLTHA